MSQTIALLIDAYRLLNARKIFWITLVLSLLVVSSFALVGIHDHGISIAWWDLEIPELNTGSGGWSKELFYKIMFTELGIKIWLAWVATILGLITTASIFPEFVTAGSIDIILSKPIGRFRLFFTKYLTGLLFVILQVSVFTGASFIVIGIRGGVWEPGIFIAIPLVVLFFSYLFSVCAVLGVITRSTIASLLLTILFWFIIFIVQSAERSLLFFEMMNEQRVMAYEDAVDRTRQRLDKVEDPDDMERWGFLHETLDKRKAILEESESTAGNLDTWHDGLMFVMTVLPKTGETIELLQRWTIDLAELPGSTDEPSRPIIDDDDHFRLDEDRLGQDMQTALRNRSPWWILGTSFIFELVVLCFGAWRFNRRDF
ncbi:MAG: hypothetical protein CMJ36_02055 [Phycisphaerae bacterium]|nr:hypothetical protein [Phycisphaerae bacterium]